MESDHTKLLFLIEFKRLSRNKKLLRVFKVIDERHMFFLEHNTLVEYFLNEE